VNPTKASDLEIRTVGDEVLVHHPSAQKVHILNRTAGQILDLCDGKRSKTDIVDSICSATSADKTTVTRDVDDLITEFTKLGLVS
jgi:coenzyme PQQ synthesis protein D (PqqD)